MLQVAYKGLDEDGSAKPIVSQAAGEAQVGGSAQLSSVYQQFSYPMQ